MTMDQFQCFECGMISSKQAIIKNHLNTVHHIKVEEETLSMKLSCSLCAFDTKNMSEYKKHLINEHEKEEHNWMVGEINTKFTCDNCEMEFPDKVTLVKHMEQIHTGEGATSKSQSNGNVKLPKFVSKIEPKYHNLVGKNVYKYSIKPDGTCQNISKAAILFADPRRGKTIAEEENKYLLQHFEQF